MPDAATPSIALPPGVVLREAALEDNDALVALFRRHPISSPELSYRVDRAPDCYACARLLGHAMAAVVAEGPGGIVGAIAVIFDRLYLNGEAREVAYTSDLKVEPAARGTGVADALMREAVAIARRRLGPDAPIITAVLGDNQAGLKKNANLERDGVAAMRPVATATTHMLVPFAPPFVGAAGLRVREARREDVPAMMALWRLTHAEKTLARAYSEARFTEWLDSAPGLRYYVAETGRGELAGFLGLWDQAAVRRFVIDEDTAMLKAARGVWNTVGLVVKLPPLPHPGETLRFRAVVNHCVAAGHDEAMTALLLRAFDDARADGALFVALALDARDPLNHQARRFWGTRSSLHLLGNEPFHPRASESDRLYHVEIALG